MAKDHRGFEIQQEEWKLIPDFPGYQISNKGRIIHVVSLKPYKGRVFLIKEGKKYHLSIDSLVKSIFRN